MREVISFWLTLAAAAAFDRSTIFDAKLRAGEGGGFPCVLRGAITMRLSSTEFYIEDASSGVRVVSEPDDSPTGELVEVEGWLYLADAGEFQLHAKKVLQLGERSPPKPRLIPLPDAIAGGYQGRLVSVRGSVLNVDFGEEFDTISIQSGRSSLRVFHPANHQGLSVFERVYPGMEVAVTGISVPQTTAPEGDGYQVRLRGRSDLAIRPGRARGQPFPVGWAGSLASVLLAGAAVWVWTGRPRRAPSASQVQYQPGGEDGAFRLERCAQGGAEPGHRA